MPKHNTQRDLTDVIQLRGKLRRDGLSDLQINTLQRQKALHSVRHGAYVSGRLWRELDTADQHRVLARAVLATAHEDTALSHTSSIIEQQGRLWGISLEVAHTTRIGVTRAGRRRDDWVPHRGVLSPDDVRIVNGVPVTKGARAALEFTTIATVEASLVAVNGLLRSQAMTLEEFAEEVDRCRHWPRTLTSDLVLRLADPRSESVGEDRVLYLCFRHSLPKPELQVEIHEGGKLIGRVDFAWPEEGIFLEFDGKIKYERYRREGETLHEFLIREKKREELICMVTGWVCLRITWDDLNHPKRLAARIRSMLARRRKLAS